MESGLNDDVDESEKLQNKRIKLQNSDLANQKFCGIKNAQNSFVIIENLCTFF